MSGLINVLILMALGSNCDKMIIYIHALMSSVFFFISKLSNILVKRAKPQITQGNQAKQ